MRVTFFDVEYANIKNKSICQIGILSKEINSKEEPIKIDVVINPEDNFDDTCVRIHGITKDRVKSAKTFPQIWDSIEKFFTNAIIVGHNVASSDLDALCKTLNRYSISLPELYYICTYNMAKQLISSFEISDYSLSTLSKYFGLNDKGLHNAFIDAVICSQLLDALVEKYNVKAEDFIEKYNAKESYNFIAYISDASLRKDIHTLYGVVTGFNYDLKLNESEIKFLLEWKDEHVFYVNHPELKNIVSIIDEIIADNIITSNEIDKLKNTIKQYLDVLSTSVITLSTQILNGIIKGIITDDEITGEECEQLRDWLYKNNYLSGHFPYDKLFSVLEKVLEDNILSKEEAYEIKDIINGLLDPVETLSKTVHSLKDKNICLSGNFSYGQKEFVEQYIIEQGGRIDKSIKKTTDILIVGDSGSDAYSNCNYGTKVKKAIEYNDKGSKIQIAKESDIIRPKKSFRDLLIYYIDKKGMSDSETYNKAKLNRQLMSKIKNPNYQYNISKPHILAFAIALELTIEETNELLMSAGYVLSVNFDFDKIIEEEIRKGNYNIDNINDKLWDAGLNLLGVQVRE